MSETGQTLASKDFRGTSAHRSSNGLKAETARSLLRAIMHSGGGFHFLSAYKRRNVIRPKLKCRLHGLSMVMVLINSDKTLCVHAAHWLRHFSVTARCTPSFAIRRNRASKVMECPRVVIERRRFYFNSGHRCGWLASQSDARRQHCGQSNHGARGPMSIARAHSARKVQTTTT